MGYPNSALSAWQLALIAVVAVSALTVWLVAVFLAAREPRPDRTASASAGEAKPISVAGADRAAGIAGPEPAREAADRQAA
jgi:membrane protein implicated in regulation of membrane protease activity